MEPKRKGRPPRSHKKETPRKKQKISRKALELTKSFLFEDLELKQQQQQQQPRPKPPPKPQIWTGVPTLKALCEKFLEDRAEEIILEPEKDFLKEELLRPFVEAFLRDRYRFGFFIDTGKKLRGLLPIFDQLDLSECCFQYPEPLTLCCRLKSLNLSHTIIRDDALLKIVELNPSLEDLNLSWCSWISTEGMIKVCRQLRCIKSLKLNNCARLSGSLLSSLADYNSETLSTLELANWSFHLYSNDILSIRRLLNLSRLNLSGLIHSSNLNKIFSSCTRITELILSDVRLDEDTLRSCFQNIKKLLVLDISGSDCSPSKEFLMKIPHLYHDLVTISVAKLRHVDDFVCDEILRHCVGLKGIDVSNTKFTGNFFMNNKYPLLEFLNVQGCKIDAKMIDSLKNSVPEIKHFWYDAVAEVQKVEEASVVEDTVNVANKEEKGQ